MKMIRLRLTDYRGIDESEVHFGSNGITIVEGANEVGKTCLGEAIRLLFEYPDSSKNRFIKAIKPVSKDVGSEIELEATSGKYTFTFFKRFNKKSETTLSITHPKVENHTGSEAHERANSILKETIDVDLWKALCIQQGEGIKQADLSKQSSLSKALDLAAGGHQEDQLEESLFGKISAEYDRYYTKQGNEKKEMKESKKKLEEVEAEVASLKADIRSLEKDADRAAELNQQLEGLKKQENELRQDVYEYSQVLEVIKKLEATLETTSLKLESAQKTEQAAKRDMDIRTEKVETISRAHQAQAELEESRVSANASVIQAEKNLNTAKLSATEAEVNRENAESLATIRRADFDYFNNKLHLELLTDRKGRIDKGRERALLAKEQLSSNNTDERALKAIEKAESAVIFAQAQLEIGAPKIILKGLSEYEFLIDGEKTTIAQEKERILTVADKTQISIPGYLEMVVKAGSSLDELTKSIDEAEQKLKAVFKKFNVGSADEANQLNELRREAELTISNQKDIESDNLGDLSYEKLENKVISLANSVPSYPTNRILDPKLSENLEEGRQILLKAEDAVIIANQQWKETRDSLNTSRKVHAEFMTRNQKVLVEHELKAEELKKEEKELERSRQSKSEDTLKSEYFESTEAVKLEEKKVHSAEDSLSEQEPEKVKALEETAQGSLTTVERKRDSMQNEKIEVQTRLKISGEAGLHEKLQAAQNKLDNADVEFKAMYRRAQAAELLYTTMKEERDTTRLAYVAPLKEKIERLGHLVFNSTFEVNVTENLDVESRAMDGSNVPFDSLSGGTREQIALITRLACAMTVSEGSGNSIILDDALGYSDPERLKLMGAVLAIAGKECQIIILTCVPDRYNNVGEAKVVSLR